MIATHQGADPQKAKLSPEEFREAISQLTAEDHARLVKVSRIHALGCPAEPEDLLQDALVKFLSGERRCPDGVSIVVALGNAMKSLAHNERKKARRTPLAPLDDESEEIRNEADDWPEGDRTRAEELANSRSRLLALFPERSYGRLIVELRLEGLRGEKIMERTGYSRKELATALRRIRRRVERAKRDGKL